MVEFPETGSGTATTCPVIGELTYLREHGLIELQMPQYLDTTYSEAHVRITARGLDFLADDGGLGAILGTVTVKLHSETIRDLLIARVEDSDEPDTVKARLIDQLKATPAQALGQLTERALDAGLRNLPHLGQLLQGWMG
ncbi:hypothetical protein [Luteimonas flava]